MKRVVKSKYLMFAILQLTLILPFALIHSVQLLLTESFSSANVWEAKKKPTSAKKTMMIQIMTKMTGVILKRIFDLKSTSSEKATNNLQPFSPLFCKERKGK